MSAAVEVTVAGGIMTITLDRADKRNALSQAMIGRIAEALAEAELSAEVRVVAVRGNGPDFCAGADLAELLASAERTLEENERDALGLGEVFLKVTGIDS